MVYKNFSRYDIDVENQTIFSNCFNKKRYLKLRETPDGYIACGVTDDKGNRYYRLHQVIFCAVNGITKDDFPKDENGYLYEIDHIDNNKKNNTPSNLRLVSKKDQMNNEITRQTLVNAITKRMSDENARKRISLALRNRKDESKRVEQWDMEGNLVAVYPSVMECERQTGFRSRGIYIAVRGGEFSYKRNKWVNCNTYKGYKWKYATD